MLLIAGASSPETDLHQINGLYHEVVGSRAGTIVKGQGVNSEVG